MSTKAKIIQMQKPPILSIKFKTIAGLVKHVEDGALTEGFVLGEIAALASRPMGPRKA